MLNARSSASHFHFILPFSSSFILFHFIPPFFIFTLLAIDFIVLFFYFINLHFYSHSQNALADRLFTAASATGYSLLQGLKKINKKKHVHDIAKVLAPFTPILLEATVEVEARIIDTTKQRV